MEKSGLIKTKTETKNKKAHSHILEVERFNKCILTGEKKYSVFAFLNLYDLGRSGQMVNA